MTKVPVVRPAGAFFFAADLTHLNKLLTQSSYPGSSFHRSCNTPGFSHRPELFSKAEKFQPVASSRSLNAIADNYGERTSTAISQNQSMPTILFADSDDDNRYLLRSPLEMKGFHVLLAMDGREADTPVCNERKRISLLHFQPEFYLYVSRITRISGELPVDLRSVRGR